MIRLAATTSLLCYMNGVHLIYHVFGIRKYEFPWTVKVHVMSTLASHRVSPCDTVPVSFSDGIDVDRVVLGDLQLSSSSSYHLSITPEQIIVFPDYDSDTTDGDLALIRLTEEVVFNDFVRPACLAPTSVNETEDYIRCVTTGWGDTETGGKNE